MFDSRIPNSRRRSILRGGAAGLTLSFLSRNILAQKTNTSTTAQGAYVPRVKHALLIGNRNYPNRKDIPPAHKNIADLAETLEFLEFKVTSHRDLDAAGMKKALTEFGGRMRGISETSLGGTLAVVFYFCGHGFQSEGHNYLVPAGVDPSSGDALKQSLKLFDDVLAMMPQRYPGISIALIDACRTDPTFKRGVDDFNQISAPEGSMVFFATRAGRPALAPTSPERNTFFAEAVIQKLNGSNGVTPIDDLFQAAAMDCQEHVKREFEKVKLKLPLQYPESTSNLRGKFVIRNRQLETARSMGLSQPNAELRESRWKEIQQTIRPGKLIRMCENFLKDFQNSEYTQTILVMITGAQQALESQKIAGLTADALEDAAGDDGYRDDLTKALRGDKDSAHRLALMYRKGSNGLAENPRRTEQWLRFSAELGNGIASWQLAEIFNLSGQLGDAAKYERKAMELGYTPPLRLSNRGY